MDSEQPSMNEEKRTALIEILFLHLADETDESKHREILQKLLGLIPFGRHPLAYIEGLNDPQVRIYLRERESESINNIKLRYDLKIFSRNRDEGGEHDLERGVYLISRLGGDPDITPESFTKNLDRLVVPLKERFVHEQSEKKKLEIFIDYMFREMGFRGNTERYYEPENSFLTKVLDRKVGIPVSLASLCLLAAKRLRLPMVGINLPGHFLLRTEGEGMDHYIDPFNEGTILSRADCMQFLVRQGIKSPDFLETADAMAIVKRMYRNLINLYSSRGDSGMEKKLRRHFSILESPSIRS